MKNVENEEWPAIQNPFTLAAEDILRHFFFTYWMNAGKFPPFNDLHNRVHEVEWFKNGPYECPGDQRMLEIYKRLLEEVS